MSHDDEVCRDGFIRLEEQVKALADRLERHTKAEQWAIGIGFTIAGLLVAVLR